MLSLKCLFGFHERSAKRARKDRKGGMRSVCRHCNRPMTRDEAGTWSVVKGAKPEPR